MILLSIVILTHLLLHISATVFTGVWVPGSDANDNQNVLTLDAGWDDFVQVFKARHDQGLRLDTVHTYLQAGQRKWAGVWRAGTDGLDFDAGLSPQALHDLNQERFDNEGLRLMKLETFVENGQRLWAGIWRSGTGAHWYNLDLDLNSFGELVQQRHQDGFRIVDIVTYVDQGQRKWGGIWVPGNDALFVFFDMDEAAFIQKANDMHPQGFTITSIRTYFDNGFKYAAVWRSDPGFITNLLQLNLDAGAFMGLTSERHQQGLAVSTFAAQTCQRGAYSFGIGNVHIEKLRSRAIFGGTDTLYVTATVAIAGRPPVTITRFYGDHSTGDTFDAGLVLENIPLGDDELAVLSYAVVNNGNSGPDWLDKVEKGIIDFAVQGAEKGLEALGVPPTIAGIVGEIIKKFGNLLFANCDGVVAAGVHQFRGADLCEKLDHGQPISGVDPNPGLNSPDGCGGNSIYDVTWFVR